MKSEILYVKVVFFFFKQKNVYAIVFGWLNKLLNAEYISCAEISSSLKISYTSLDVEMRYGTACFRFVVVLLTEWQKMSQGYACKTTTMRCMLTNKIYWLFCWLLACYYFTTLHLHQTEHLMHISVMCVFDKFDVHIHRLHSSCSTVYNMYNWLVRQTKLSILKLIVKYGLGGYWGSFISKNEDMQCICESMS